MLLNQRDRKLLPWYIITSLKKKKKKKTRKVVFTNDVCVAVMLGEILGVGGYVVVK